VSVPSTSRAPRPASASPRCADDRRDTRTGAFTRRLDREWHHLRRRRRVVGTARSWRRRTTHVGLDQLLAGIVDLDELLAATQAGRPDADAILLELVRLSRSDELAGRVVVQRLLPGLIARAAPYRSHHDDTDPAELAVPAAWLAIRRFDTDRRRSHVAARLVSDATDQAFRRPLRRRAAGDRPAAPATFVARPTVPSPTAIEELATVVREAAASGVPAADLDLIRHLARAGSPSIVADAHGVTTRTIRNRRDRAVARIRSALLAA
jgi:hypothetical protein